MRRGFTLLELLVACGVFIIGFVAIFTLFLLGMRFRRLSEDTTRAALAASSLINEIHLTAGTESTTPSEPAKYVGDGFAATKPDDGLFAYPPQPGVWYRVRRSIAADNPGKIDPNAPYDPNDPYTSGLRLTIFVLPWASSDRVLDFGEVRKRLQLVTFTTDDTLMDELVRRRVAYEYEAVVLRTPSWMKP